MLEAQFQGLAAQQCAGELLAHAVVDQASRYALAGRGKRT
jgi:hypothetical protein